jgi:hypothetical protein
MTSSGGTVDRTHQLSETVALLARTPAVLDALLRGLPEIWTLRNEGGLTWSPLHVVAHLIHAERTNVMPRVRVLLEFGETQSFAPFEREPAQEHRPLAQLLDEFAQLRRENLAALEALHLTEEDLDRRGEHPAFGSVTLAQLLATWAAHDLTHLHQLSRVMAYQYREAVGPWSAYLGVLRCNGHSS